MQISPLQIFIHIFSKFQQSAWVFTLKFHIIKIGNRNMIKLILICFFLVSALADCPLAPYPRRTIVGIITAQIDNDPRLHGNPIDYVYPLTQDLAQGAVSVAIGVIGFEVNSHNLLDFQVKYMASSSLSSLRFRVSLNDTAFGWKSLRFNFFASQSFLFQAQSAVAQIAAQNQTLTKAAVIKNITNYSNFEVEPVIKVFIHGLVMKSKPLDAEYDKILAQYNSFRQFSNNQKLANFFYQAVQNKKAMEFKIYDVKIIAKLLKFTVETNAEVPSITYSYLLFSKRTLSEMHNFKTDTFSIFGTTQYKFQSLQSTGMVFSGFNGIKVTRDTNSLFSLSNSDVGSNTFFSVEATFEFFEYNFTFVALEMKINYVCQDCPDSPIIHENKFCVQACPRGFSLSEANGLKYCDRCEVEKIKVVDTISGLCVCAKRYFLDSAADTCRPCSYDCMTCNGVDKCLTCDNTMLQTKRKLTSAGRCQCPSVGFYDDKKAENIICQKCDSKCVTCNGPYAHDCLTCGPGRKLDQNSFCLCENGFQDDSSGNCICPPPFNIVNGQCQGPCGPNKDEIVNGASRECVCKAGTISVGPDCIKCQQNAVFNKTILKCECQKPFTEIDGQCIGCGANQVYDQVYKVCACSNGAYKKSDGSCVTCPPKMVLVDDECECIYNFYPISPVVCKPCLRQTDGPQCKRNVF